MGDIEKLLQWQSFARTSAAGSDDAQLGTDVPASPRQNVNESPTPLDSTSHAPSTYDEARNATAGAHSSVASKKIEQAVSDSPVVYQDIELAAALNALKDMVDNVEDTLEQSDSSKPQAIREQAEAIEALSEAEIDQLTHKAGGRQLVCRDSLSAYIGML